MPVSTIFGEVKAMARVGSVAKANPKPAPRLENRKRDALRSLLARRRSPLPDFYIGAHAAIRGATLLARWPSVVIHMTFLRSTTWTSDTNRRRHDQSAQLFRGVSCDGQRMEGGSLVRARAIPQRFRHVDNAHEVIAGKIGDRAGDAEHAVKCAR